MKIVFQNNFKYEIHNNYLCGSKYLMRAVDGKQGIDKCQPNIKYSFKITKSLTGDRI